MHLLCIFLTLFAWAPITIAFPGYSSPTPSYPYSTPEYPQPPAYSPPPSYETCSAVYTTRTDVGASTSTYLTTKTIYVPVTTISGSPKTTVRSYPVTSIGISTKTITSVETGLITKTYPITTVTYSTAVEEVCNTTTKEEFYPCTSVYTSYITDVTTCPIEIVTSTPSSTICSETTTIPYLSTVIETLTTCTTQGYGHGI